MDLKLVCYLITIFATGFSCQDPWMLEAPDMLKWGSQLIFVNETIVGVKEEFKWNWFTPRGDAWNVHYKFLQDSRNEEITVHFKPSGTGKRNIVGITWSRNDQDGTKWNYNKMMIKQPEWKLTVKDVIKMHFIPLERDWIFKVDDEQIYGTGLQMAAEEYSRNDFYVDDARRLKRSPQYDSGAPTEAGFGEWMTKIWDFFFGGDRGRGEPDGIFTRLGNWLRGISCSLHGPCDQPEPDTLEGPFPPRTVPTTVRPVTPPQLNPEAEIIPELNNV